MKTTTMNGLKAAMAEWAKSIGKTPTKYEAARFAEGFRRAQRRNADPTVTSACPYGVGDGNVSLAEWAWNAGYEFWNHVY